MVMESMEEAGEALGLFPEQTATTFEVECEMLSQTWTMSPWSLKSGSTTSSLPVYIEHIYSLVVCNLGTLAGAPCRPQRLHCC